MGMILLLTVAFAPRAVCEMSEGERILSTLDLAEVHELGESVGLDMTGLILSLISDGETGDAWNADGLKAAILEQLLGDIRPIAAQLAVPLIMSVLMRILLGQAGAERGVFGLICRLCCASALCTAFVQVIRIAAALIKTAIRCADALTPVLISAFALSGQNSAGSAFASMSAICTDLIQELLGKWGITLSIAAAGAAIGGNFSGKIRLKRLHGMIKDLFQWGVGVIMAGFMGMLAIRGRLESLRDSAGVRTARYAIESVIPIIGGDVSDSLGSLLSAAVLVRNALGASGLVLILSSALIPLARLAGVMIALKLVAALCEPLGDDIQAAMLAQSAETCEMILVTCAAACLLCALLVGSCMTAVGGAVS